MHYIPKNKLKKRIHADKYPIANTINIYNSLKMRYINKKGIQKVYAFGHFKRMLGVIPGICCAGYPVDQIRPGSWLS